MTAGSSTSRSGTASAASCSATATRSSSASRNEQAADPLLPRGRRGRARAAAPRCVVDGEIVVARGRAARLRGPAAAHPPGRRPGRRCWPRETPASFVAFDLLALGDDDLMAPPFADAAPPARGGAGGRRAAGPPHARDRRRRRGPAAGSRRSRAPGSTGSSPSRSTSPYQPDKRRHAQGQARAHRRLRGGRASAGTRAARSSARCCSASTTTTGDLQHVGVRRRSRWPGAPSWSTSWRRWRTDDLDGPPVGRLGDAPERGRTRTAMPGRGVAVERRQGPVAGCRCAPSCVVEVAYDHMEGNRFRHTAAVPALAPRPRRGVVHVRAARAAGAATTWPRARRRVTAASAGLCLLIGCRRDRDLASSSTRCTPTTSSAWRTSTAPTRDVHIVAATRRRAAPSPAPSMRRERGAVPQE